MLHPPPGSITPVSCRPKSASSVDHLQKMRTRNTAKTAVLSTLQGMRQDQRVASRSRLYAISDRSRVALQMEEPVKRGLVQHLLKERWQGIEQLPLRRNKSSTLVKQNVSSSRAPLQEVTKTSSRLNQQDNKHQLPAPVAVKNSTNQHAVLAMQNLGRDLLNLDSSSSKETQDKENVNTSSVAKKNPAAATSSSNNNNSITSLVRPASAYPTTTVSGSKQEQTGAEQPTTTRWASSSSLGKMNKNDSSALSRANKGLGPRPTSSGPKLRGGKKIEGLAGDHPSDYHRHVAKKKEGGIPIVPEPGDPDADVFFEESEQYRKEDLMKEYVKRKMDGSTRPRSASASRIKTQLREAIDDDEITSLFCEKTGNVIGAAKKYKATKAARPKTANARTNTATAADPDDPLRVTHTWLAPGELPVHPATLLRQKFLQRSQSAGALRSRPVSAWGPGPDKANALEPIIDKRLDIPNLVFEALLEPGTKFRKMFERGDLPIAIKHGSKMTLEWRVPVESVNTRIFLPIFVDGIRERKFPFNYVSFEGTMSMIRTLNEDRLAAALPEVMQSIHRNMLEKDRNVICKCIKVLRELVPRGPTLGEALIPHYKLFLPILNLFVCEWRNLGDEMDFAQRHEDGRNIAIMSQELLQLMERAAPETAFYNIKYSIPTYESCLQ
ncbi:unnamed protein product [Amoebophrya sp. A120]|nr:unnamed protein product [Amoebophrya sp. A120]|eukprot:GSA120T00024237001.1